MVEEKEALSQKGLARRFSIISIFSGIILFITSLVLGNLSEGGEELWLPPYTIPAQLGVFMGPLSIIGGILVYLMKGFKIALAGAIGMTTASVFALIFTVALIVAPKLIAVTATIIVIDIALLFCLFSGVYCCDYLLKIKDSRYSL